MFWCQYYHGSFQVPYIYTHTHTYTCSEPRHRRRGVPVRRVARPELPVDIVAPAVDAAVDQQGARVIDSRGDGHDACGPGETRREATRVGRGAVSSN